MIDEMNLSNGSDNNQPSPSVPPAAKPDMDAIRNPVMSDNPATGGIANAGVIKNQPTMQQPQAPQQSKHGGIFQSIMETLAGPQYQYHVDPQTGSMVKTPVQRTKGQLANAIVAGALTGLFAGAGQSGPNRQGKALAAGANAVEQRKKEADKNGMQMASADYNRRIATTEYNMRLRQNAMQYSMMDTKFKQQFADMGKAVFDELQQMPGALMEGGQLFSASELPDLLKKYNVTQEAAIPVSVGLTGQNGPNGEPQTELKYAIVNPNFEVNVPDTLLKKFQKYNIPGWVGNDGKPLPLPKDAKTRALLLMHSTQQVGMAEAFDQYRQQWLKPNAEPQAPKSEQENKVEFGPTSTKIPEAKDPKLGEIADQIASNEGVDKGLVRAVINAESRWNPGAKSPKGALGLMQLMPQTAAGLKVNNPLDPEQNIKGGVAYLKQLLDKYDGDVKKALAAYNWGPEKLARVGYDLNKIPDETKSYIADVLNTAGIK